MNLALKSDPNYSYPGIIPYAAGDIFSEIPESRHFSSNPESGLTWNIEGIIHVHGYWIPDTDEVSFNFILELEFFKLKYGVTEMGHCK